MNHIDIKQSIMHSQHCQRNWNLSKEIPESDLNLLVFAGTQCPSKQNIAFYRLHYITNRDIIEKIHSKTKGFVVKLEPTPEYTTNTQTLANLLVVFEKYENLDKIDDSSRNDQTRAIASNAANASASATALEVDRMLAVGIAAGYLTLTANMLNYSSGFCSCFNGDEIREILNLENDIMLLIGIGFNQPGVDWKVSHVNNSYVYPAKTKQPISVNFIK